MNIVICCDGTWDERDGNIGGGGSPSNVYRMSEAALNDGVNQLCKYFNGVGTEGNWLDRALGGAFGAGLDARIQEAYKFLAEKYNDDDEIFLFGFSRGAYTVRSLAGLIRNSGLLRASNLDRLEEAYALYRNREPGAYPDGDAAKEFRRAYSREPRIKCIGVWDTVGALGVPFGLFEFLNEQYQFHDVALSRFVDNAFQALAIDERRKPFKPTLWAQQAEAAASGQVLKQVWFSGVHTDVGGGATQNFLSSIAFKWMASQAESCGLSIQADYVDDRANFTLNPEQPLDGEIEQSCTGLYELLGPYDRPIGEGAQIEPGGITRVRYAVHHRHNGNAESNEAVSACAKVRYDLATTDPGFRYRSFNPSLPPELQSYLASPDAIVTSSCP